MSDPSESPAHPSAPSPLETFRAKTKRLTIHPLEMAALWVIGAHMVFLPWALGTMRPWAQWVSLGFSLVGFALALIPRDYNEEHTGSNRFRLLTWPKLVRFPIFWLGLSLLGLVVCQALNPAWAYRTDGKVFWMEAIPHKDWLPQGVIAPFASWNQWRMLVIYSSALLTVCSVWVAFTRRRTLQLFLMTVAVNGLAIAIVGIAQRLLRADKIFWFVHSSNAQFFGSFIYKNHGGIYLDLILAATCGIVGWFYLRGIRRLEKSNPSGVLAFFATCIAVAVLTSYARGATLVMLAFLILTIGAFIVHQFKIPKESRRPVISFVLICIFGYFLKTGFEALQTHEAWDRLRQGVMREDLSLEFREKNTRSSLEMLGETWKTGIGAGTYRFVYPLYQFRHPELVESNGQRMFWEHAHNDILELPIELGALGVGIIALGFLYWGYALLKNYFWANPVSACLAVGLTLVLGYAWWDFPFQCPAILTTWCVLWAAATMWARFEESGAKG